MHSILENDAILNDPYEVLCCIGTLIIEGRTSKTVLDSNITSDYKEVTYKVIKPYNEGPHCPNHTKTCSKDAHKCADNNILCIRYKNLRQHLHHLYRLSSSIIIEVSLGPDCLCGELRSQSTLVSTQFSKKDTVLEQWTINMASKTNQEPSTQLCVLNIYQAVRSLLHFSQLAAWYTNTNGLKPAHVIYRVIVPEDATYIADDEFINHNLPTVNISKTVSIKISLKTLPRKEKIPTVICLQHPCSSPESNSEESNFDEPSDEKNFQNPKPSNSTYVCESKTNLLQTTLPLKFHGVRKKTNEAQERKRKKHIALYASKATPSLDGSSGSEILDGMPDYVEKLAPHDDPEYSSSKRTFLGTSMIPCKQENSSKVDVKKSKPSIFSANTFSEFVKQEKSFQTFENVSRHYFDQKSLDPAIDEMLSLNGLGDAKRKCDFRTKGLANVNMMGSSLNNTKNKTVMDILDDRMQISCAISGKHHCKWECEEETELGNVGGNAEKPKRRRSLSRVIPKDGLEKSKSGDLNFEKVLFGKFKAADGLDEDLISFLKESQISEVDKLEQKLTLSDLPSCSKTCPAEFAPKTKLCISQLNAINALAVDGDKILTPKIESLPINDLPKNESEAEEKGNKESSQEHAEESNSSRSKEGNSNRIRRESFESFKKGCAMASHLAVPKCDSDSDDELSDGFLESSNPFLAAILRTTRKSKSSLDCEVEKIVKEENTFDSKNKGGKSRKSSTVKNITMTSNSSECEKNKNPFKYFLHRKNIAESETKAKEAFKKSKSRNCGPSGKLSVASGIDRCGTSFRSTRKKSNAVKALKDLNLESTSIDAPDFSIGLNSALDKEENLNREVKEDKGLDGKKNSDVCSHAKTIPVPSAYEKLRFKRSLDTAAQLVFHRYSGLPLTSSPAPVRRNNNSFSFDSSLNSVSAIKSALFEPSNCLSSEDENESEGSLKSPVSPGAWSVGSKQINYHSLSPLPLLGSFEESVLNGRLEPVSTVQGFTAELGASGSFCPRHLYLPVTVFFYTLGDNDKVSAPYLGHINLGKKGYNVPRSGTVQVTLFNPLRTVVKMFVVVYDLSDMPANSHTFLRQRTLYVPTSQKETTYVDKNKVPFDQEDYHKYLRYLIHLRFVSGKTGRIYLHTDIRMVIFRKADEDTANALGRQIDGETYELRSHTHGPINPKFSPRK